jgi:hypothetical protein
MNRAKLFALMAVLGGVGAGVGVLGGRWLGTGGSLALGFVVGAALVVLGGVIATARHWILRNQRTWVLVGAGAGFALACVVALATISHPVAPALSWLLVGVGAVLGTVLGSSPHGTDGPRFES